MQKYIYLLILISISGIVLLLFVAQNSIPSTVDLSKINSKEIYDKISVEAKIISIRNYDGLKLLRLEDHTDSINAVLYAKNLSLELNQTYKIIGQIQEYNKEKQINIKKILKK